ncbi:fibronectin type III domain-containing protein, partial [Frankia canadensis]|uniref:fibronectin type III domain-containing protein n=1 Tax=Frankia canadensis TaxID=1836972 RepID=UPI001401C2A9
MAVPSAVVLFAAPAVGAASPSAPSNVTVTGVGAGAARVSWTDTSSDETGFDVAKGSETRHAGPNATSFDWGGLGSGPACFKVRSVNAAGTSAWAPSGGLCLAGAGAGGGGSAGGAVAGGAGVGGAGRRP